MRLAGRTALVTGASPGIVNLLKIASRGLSLEKICGCVSGENTGVRESTKPCIGLSLLHRRAIFCVNLIV